MQHLATFTGHGGRIAAARARFGGGDWIDLSTGIAPWAYPLDGIGLALDRLPEPDEIAELEAAAAVAFGVADAAAVIAVPGTDLAMRLLARLIEAERPAVVAPGYAGHRAAWPGATVVDEATAFGTGAVSGTDLLVLASPSNPSGRIIDSAGLSDLTARITVVLDQAYADPTPCPQPSDGLVVLRSFGKFYGLPGVRLGFVVADPPIAKQMRALLGDWPVSTAAIAIGTAAYRDTAWRDAQVTRITAMADALDALDLPVVGRSPLFRLIETPDAARLFEHLARRAILTRPFADQSTRLRIGLPRDEAALDRLCRALEDHR